MDGDVRDAIIVHRPVARARADHARGGRWTDADRARVLRGARFCHLARCFSRRDALDFVKTVFEPAVPANRLSAAARRESWFNVEDLPRYDAIPNPTDVLKYSPRVAAILRQMHEKPFSIRGGEALSIRPARSWLTPQFIVPPTKHWHVDEHGIDGNHDLSCVVLFHFSDTEIGGGGGTAILDGSHKWLALLARCVPKVASAPFVTLEMV